MLSVKNLRSAVKHSASQAILMVLPAGPAVISSSRVIAAAVIAASIIAGTILFAAALIAAILHT